MTVTFPLTIPFPEFAQVDLQPQNVRSASRSAFTGKRQIQIYPGEYWAATVTWPELADTDGRVMAAFLNTLRGEEGNFILPDRDHQEPLGAALTVPSQPTVDGSGQVGRTLAIKNAPASTTGWLLRGTRFQGGPFARCQLFEVLNDVDTDAGGKAVIDVWPRVRGGLIAGDEVRLFGPHALMCLEEPASWSVAAPFRYEISIECAEDF